jgi:hypothetical protein
MSVKIIKIERNNKRYIALSNKLGTLNTLEQVGLFAKQYLRFCYI